MEGSLFILTKPRVIIAIVYAGIMGFLLAEKFWLDYCYHIKKGLAWPDARLGLHLLGTLPLAILLIWFSFVYGRGAPVTSSSSTVVVELFFTAMTLYVAWTVGLFREMPFFNFLKHAAVFIVLVGLLNLVIGLTAKSVPHFTDWIVACLVLTLACFGYYRAFSDCLGLSHQPVPLWQIKDFMLR